MTKSSSIRLTSNNWRRGSQYRCLRLTSSGSLSLDRYIFRPRILIFWRREGKNFWVRSFWGMTSYEWSHEFIYFCLESSWYLMLWKLIFQIKRLLFKNLAQIFVILGCIIVRWETSFATSSIRNSPKSNAKSSCWVSTVLARQPYSIPSNWVMFLWQFQP